MDLTFEMQPTNKAHTGPNFIWRPWESLISSKYRKVSTKRTKKCKKIHIFDEKKILGKKLTAWSAFNLSFTMLDEKCISNWEQTRTVWHKTIRTYYRRRRECRREKQAAAELAQGKVTQAPRYHTDARKVSAARGACASRGRRSSTAQRLPATRAAHYLRARVQPVTHSHFIYLLVITHALLEFYTSVPRIWKALVRKMSLEPSGSFVAFLIFSLFAVRYIIFHIYLQFFFCEF